MRIAVFGTGAVGGYFGARLAQAGEEVIFIARGEHLAKMQKDGLKIESIKGDLHLQPVQATDNPKRIGEVDAVLLGVKAWQVPEAAEAILPMIGEDSVVVPLQNGVDAPSQLAAVLGKDHVAGGLCRISSAIVAPGHIRHTAIEPYVAFGELDNRPSPRLERLRDAFLRAGVNAEIPADIHVAMWQKFIFIAAISGVGAITRAPVGVIRSIPESRELLEQAIKEGVAVARGRKINLPDGYFEQIMAFIDQVPPHTTASMQRDIMENRPSELASQNGAMERLGLEVGVATPTHSFIYHALLPQELRARGEIAF